MDGAVEGPGTRVGSPALLPVDWSQFHGVDLHAQHHHPVAGAIFSMACRSAGTSYSC